MARVEDDTDRAEDDAVRAQDVTARRKLGEALAGSEEKFRTLAESAACAILVYQDDRLTYVNPAAAEITGFSREELVGKTLWELIAPDSQQHVRQRRLARARGEVVPARSELKIITKDGSERWLDYAAGFTQIGGRATSVGTAYDISERKRAEQALRDSEARVRRLFEQANDAIFVISAENRFLDVNARALEMLGYSREEFLRLGVADIVVAQERPRLETEPAAMMAGTPHFSEWMHVRKDGSTFPAEVSARRLNEESYLAIVRDLTERHRAAEALRQSEERLRLALDAAHMGTFDWEVPNGHITWSRWHEELWGYHPGEFPGTYEAFAQRLHPEDAPGVDAEVARCIAAREPFNREFRVVWPDASVHWVVGRGEFDFDAAGQPLRMRGVVVEITERKRAEEALREAQRRLEEAQRRAHLGGWENDPERMQGYWSAEMYRIYRRDPALGVPSFEDFFDLVHPQDRDLVRSAYAQTLETGRPGAVDLRTNPEHGEIRYLNATFEVLRDAEGRVVRVAGTALDVSERRAAEAERERLQAELRRSEMLAAMGRLVGGVAHEVRNPLFGISATLDAFEARFGSEGQEHLRVLREQLGRLNDLMRDLLEYGKPVIPVLTPAALGDVVADGVRGCAALAAQHGVEIAVEATPCAPVAMDRERMRQVLQNLIQNAVQLSPRGGRVRLTVRAVVADGRRLVECEVTDEGRGFRAEDLPHVFEPFFSRRRGGTGLGLAIAQRIIDEHRGTISAANRPAGGAVLTLRLPEAES